MAKFLDILKVLKPTGDVPMKRRVYDSLHFSGTWFQAMVQIMRWLFNGKLPVTVKVEFYVEKPKDNLEVTDKCKGGCLDCKCGGNPK